jgi:hypothetical protein
MWRLAFMVLGLALLFFAHALVWSASGQAESALGNEMASAPKDYAVAYVVMVAVGFVLFVGSVLEGFYNTWTSMITSGHNISREVAMARRDEGLAIGSRLGWGLPLYLVIALVFGLYVRLGIYHQKFVPWMLTDPSFMGFALSWPYHFLAAAGPWGFTLDKFY